MAAEIESSAQTATPGPAAPAAAPAAASGAGRGGRGRGGRGGRGRGRGGGRGGASSTTTANAGITKPAVVARGGRGGTRRGRAKTFPEARVQAAYERQRDLKQLYQTVAAMMKPALQDLADRNIEDIVSDPDAFRRAIEYAPCVRGLDERLQDRCRQISARTDLDQQLADRTHEAEQQILHQTYEVSLPMPYFHLFTVAESTKIRGSLNW